MLQITTTSSTDFNSSSTKSLRRTSSRWGRVGEKGQSKTLGDGTFDSAPAAFSKKFKEKTGLQWEARKDSPRKGKYTFIERMYEDSSNEEDEKLPGAEKRRQSGQSTKSIESKLPGPVKRLMEVRTFDSAHHTAIYCRITFSKSEKALSPPRSDLGHTS